MLDLFERLRKQWLREASVPGTGNTVTGVNTTANATAPFAEPVTAVGPDGRGRDLFILDFDLLDDATKYLGDDPVV